VGRTLPSTSSGLALSAAFDFEALLPEVPGESLILIFEPYVEDSHG